MDWHQAVFEYIDLRSFSNLWYWIAVAVVWSSASHWVLGVPFDMVLRARRHGGEAEEDLQDIVRVNVKRMLYVVDVSGLWVVGFMAALLTVLLMLGFWYWIEFAQAVTLIVLPMCLVWLLSLRTARRIYADDQGGPLLHRRLARHRFWVQVIGLISIFVTSLWGMSQNLAIGAI